MIEQLKKSIQSFEELTMQEENRQKLYRYQDALMQSIHSILQDDDCDADRKMQYLTNTLDQYASAMKDLLPQIITKSDDSAPEDPPQEEPAEPEEPAEQPGTVTKKSPAPESTDRYDLIVEVEKFNPYHDSRGRFTTAGGATSFTIRTKDPSKQGLADAAKEREKARTSGGAAAPADDGEAARTKAIHDIEDQIRHQNYETAAVVDKDGKALIYKDGAKNNVGFTRMECMMMKDNVLTHNHPGSSMFSYEDTNCFVRNNMKEIRATTRDGTTYSLKRGEGYSFEKGVQFTEDYASGYKTAINRAQVSLDKRGFREKIWSGEISQSEANREFSKVVTQEMIGFCKKAAPDYGIEYSVEKREVKPKAMPKVYNSKYAADNEIVLDAETNKMLDTAFNEWLNKDQKPE